MNKKCPCCGGPRWSIFGLCGCTWDQQLAAMKRREIVAAFKDRQRRFTLDQIARRKARAT